MARDGHLQIWLVMTGSTGIFTANYIGQFKWLFSKRSWHHHGDVKISLKIVVPRKIPWCYLCFWKTTQDYKISLSYGLVWCFFPPNLSRSFFDRRSQCWFTPKGGCGSINLFWAAIIWAKFQWQRVLVPSKVAKERTHRPRKILIMASDDPQ